MDRRVHAQETPDEVRANSMLLSDYLRHTVLLLLLYH
jgi:hypothetical protein